MADTTHRLGTGSGPPFPPITTRITEAQHAIERRTAAEVSTALATGRAFQLGRIPYASNDTRLITVTADARTLRAVYKPVRGERPLRDFPPGSLAGREVACAALADWLGLPVIAPTVLRTDLPAGTGSVQAFVETDGAAESLVDVFAPADVPAGWAPVLAAVDEEGADLVVAHALEPELRRVAVFDLIVNNADRKASHLLIGHHSPARCAPHLFGIDHGLTFHTEPKLRTVLWGFAGQAFSREERELLAAVAGSAGELGALLGAHLSAAEVTAASVRAAALLETAAFPLPPEHRTPIPWPPL